MTFSKEEFEKLFEIFKIECDEHIQKLNSGILTLEENPDNPALLSEILRDAHSLKGAARMIDFKSIEEISHNLETILGKIKKGEITLSTEITNLIFNSLENIAEIVKIISQGGREDEVDVSSLIEQLKQVSKGELISKPATKKQKAVEEKDSVLSLPKEDVTVDMNLFIEETTDSYQSLVNSLIKIEKSPQNKKDSVLNLPKEIESAYNQIHALKGSARMIKHNEMDSLSLAMEQILSGVMDKNIVITAPLISTLLSGADFIKIFIHQIGSEMNPPYNWQNSDEVLPKDIDQKAFKNLIAAINLFNPTPAEVSTKTPAPKKGYKPGEEASAIQPKSTVRVSSEKLDRLMEEVGELLIMKLKAKQRVTHVQSIINDCNSAKQAFKKDKRSIHLNTSQVSSQWSVVSNQLSVFSDRLDSLHRTLSDDSHQLSLIIENLQDDIKKTRLLPFHTIMGAFPKMVRDIAVSENKKVRFEFSGGDIELDKYILEEIKSPLMHMLRNSIDHGIEPPDERIKSNKTEDGTIKIILSQKGNNAIIEIIDDGRGMDIEDIKGSAVKKGLYTEKEIHQMKERQILNIIFQPGFSTSKMITDISGRGIGMDVVKATIEKLNGTIDIEALKDKGTRFVLTIPLTLSITHAIKFFIGNEICYIPINMVERIIKVEEKNLPTIEGGLAVHYNGSTIPYVRMQQILDISESDKKEDAERLAVILKTGNTMAAFAIDKFIGEEDITIKGLGNYMKRVRNVSGVTIMSDGNIAPILNVTDMINTIQLRGITSAMRKKERVDIKKNLSILVVDDSIMTRTLEKNILESYGYDVVTAIDGQDAILKIREKNFDVIVSDVQMPNMSGLELTEKIKQDNRYSKIPVILVTAMESDEDKKKGIQIGADAYIVKSSFDQSNLLTTIKRLTQI
ncbi:MAG: hybrid sensor histidine kinase/response regulator [Nitrospinae bacterium]|nr:hybrid sensor histidine kinase/response regulator [Nitrospinota bacterium]